MTTSAVDHDVPGAVERVTEAVSRIALPLPMRDLRVVNAYVIGGSDGVTLIDPGWANAESEATLVRGLASLGFAPLDVRRILVTHAHWDHYTQALKWQKELGATVYLGDDERRTIGAFATLHGAYPNQVGLLRVAGAEALADDVSSVELEAHERDMVVGPPDVWLRDGDQIDCGATTIVAHATPGHTRGHMVFEDLDAGLLFTGDHVLPRITPSIGFERCPDRYALRAYLQSLRVCMSRPAATMLPAHGSVGTELGARVEQLLAHHDERLDRIRALVSAGAATAYDVACRMRWTRHDRSIDELGTVHGMTAVLEVLAHLDVLESQGLLVSEKSGAARHYRAS
jgi:glyoxylase-like metal-dependent hydrolase (beta-lactamase superfamily II)